MGFMKQPKKLDIIEDKLIKISLWRIFCYTEGEFQGLEEPHTPLISRVTVANAHSHPVCLPMRYRDTWRQDIMVGITT